MSTLTAFLELFPEEILAKAIDLGFPEEDLRAYYGVNLFSWLHSKLKKDPQEFSDLPRAFRDFLSSHLDEGPFAEVREFSASDGAKKYAFRCKDGSWIESVYIPAGRRRTVCLSTQVGCRWGCRFCYTGKMGFVRNLTCAEILEQAYEIVRREGKITHLVYMGMGEPLDNYDAVLRSIRIFNHPKGQHIGMRRITISTVGIIPAIERLMAERLQVNLAVSLHSAIPEVRAELVPAERAYPLKRLVPLLQRYYAQTHRQITFEYVVIPEVNDDMKSARALAKLVRGWDCKVNLIPQNLPSASSRERKALKQRTYGFYRRLLSLGVTKVTIRFSRALDVGGACGLLGSKMVAGSP